MSGTAKIFFGIFAAVAPLMASADVSAAGLLVRYRPSAGGKAAALSLPSDREVVRIETDDPEADLAALRSDPGVAHAEPDVAVEPAGLPDDPLLHAGFVSLYSYESTGLVDAWEIRKDCSATVVAVLDGGIDLDHPDLKDNLWVNSGEIPDNGEDDDGNGYADDVHGYDFVGDDGDVRDGVGHGTAVAGIVGAVGDNGIGLSGVCWSARIMPLKIFGDGEGEGGTLSAALRAMDYAIDHGARVVNLSWVLQGGKSSRFLEEVIREAEEAGVLVVAAAGNDGKDLAEEPVYPAAYEAPNLLTVSASDRDGGRSDFSNYGDGIVDLAAPGNDVMTTDLGSEYVFFSGTSAAAPHVSGAAALLMSQDPEMTAVQAASLLKATAQGDSRQLNALEALTVAEDAAVAVEGVPEAPAQAEPAGGGCGLVRS